MCFIRKIRENIRLNKEKKKLLIPFLFDIKSKLRLLEILDLDISDEVAKAYEIIKESNKKKYVSIIEYYDSLKGLVLKHNNDVQNINNVISSFNKESIFENILSISKDEIELYYEVAKKLDNFDCLDENVLQFKKDATLIYSNYDIIRNQKLLYNEKKQIKECVDSNCNYLDDEFVKPLRDRDAIVEGVLKVQNELFYDFKSFFNFELLIDNHNETFIENNKTNKLFDDINGRSLDNEQREAVLIDELSTLVVAGAGSGKTLTICGKVEYLLKEKNVSPNDILLLSYSKKSADDLQNKVSKIDGELTVGTFHKIGLEVLKETKNKVFMVEDQYKAIIEKYFREEMKNRPHMLQTILTYYGLYIASVKHDKKYENEGELFEDLKKQDFSTLKNQLVNLSNNSIKHETLKKEHVKSFEEMAIANWYFINGIDYIYEAPYEVDVSTPEKRQYMPDFYLPNYKIYHEHYGINKEGKAEQFKGEEAQNYVSNMDWKRCIHESNNTKCLETYSYEFDDGSVFDKLEKELKENGVEFNPLSDKEIFNALESIYEGQAFKSFINLTRTFLSLYKARYKDVSGFDELLKYQFDNSYESKRANLFLSIVKDIYLYYIEYLRKEDKIDFDDMILQSTIELDKCDDFKYKYIIVDEFQDISLSRMLFLKKLVEHGHSKLFAVGDDWQAIYRFSGCDLNIFLKFAEYFGASKITNITTTHRNSQELQDIAGPFIKANPEQFSKQINSARHLDHPVRIMYYSDDKYYSFMDVLKEIDKMDSEAKVLILGRNNRDIESILFEKSIYIDYKQSKGTQTVIKVRDYPNMSFSYSTVHGSKGLEEDYVIIINADDTRLGFPNKMEDDELLDMVLSSKSTYEYAEERRLWYVALTRTKTYTYIIASKYNPSIFVQEIEKQCLVMNPDVKQKDENVISCPQCKSGKLVTRTSEGSKFFGCSNYPYCDYTINDFEAVIKNKRCGECGDFMVLRKGKWGTFYGCYNYPRCNYTEKYDPLEEK